MVVQNWNISGLITIIQTEMEPIQHLYRPQYWHKPFIRYPAHDTDPHSQVFATWLHCVNTTLKEQTELSSSFHWYYVFIWNIPNFMVYVTAGMKKCTGHLCHGTTINQHKLNKHITDTNKLTFAFKIEEFIASNDYIYHQCCLDSHMKRVAFFLERRLQPSLNY